MSSRVNLINKISMNTERERKVALEIKNFEAILCQQPFSSSQSVIVPLRVRNENAETKSLDQQRLLKTVSKKGLVSLAAVNVPVHRWNDCAARERQYEGCLSSILLLFRYCGAGVDTFEEIGLDTTPLTSGLTFSFGFLTFDVKKRLQTVELICGRNIVQGHCFTDTDASTHSGRISRPLSIVFKLILLFSLISACVFLLEKHFFVSKVQDSRCIFFGKNRQFSLCFSFLHRVNHKERLVLENLSNRSPGVQIP